MLAPLINLLEALAGSFDIPVLDWIQANMQSGLMDTIMPIITLFGDGGIFWIGIAVVLLIFPKTRKTGIAMGVALVIGVIVCNVTLKPLIGRIRPYEFAGRDLSLMLVSLPSDPSFPSGHTIASFEACTVLLVNDKRMGIPATILAFLIAFSRLYLYVHYPTDVIFSFVFGILFGVIGDALVSAIWKKHGPRKGRFETAA